MRNLIQKLIITLCFTASATAVKSQAYFIEPRNTSYYTDAFPYLDSSFVLLGGSNKRSAFSFLKLDSKGEITSSKLLYLQPNNLFHSHMILQIAVNPDSSITILGASNRKLESQSIYDQDLLILKIDKHDSVIFCKTIVDSSSNIRNQEPKRILGTQDGGWIITAQGRTSSMIYDYDTSIVMKIDKNGNTEWSYTYRGGRLNIGSVTELTSGEFIALGRYIDHPPTYANKLAFIKLAPNGKVLEAKTIKDDDYISTNVIGIVDTNIISFGLIWGSKDNLSSISLSGKVNWTRRYNNISDVAISPNSSFFACGVGPGYDSLTKVWNSNILLAKLDQEGLPIWAKNYQTESCADEVANTISVNSKNVFIVGNHQYYLGSDKRHLFTDTLGTAPCGFNVDSVSYTTPSIPDSSETISLIESPWLVTQDYKVPVIEEFVFHYVDACTKEFSPCGVGIQDQIKAQEIQVYPNPFTNQLTIELSAQTLTTIRLYDLLGKELLNDTFINSIQVNTEHLPKGLYLFTLSNSDGTLYSGKVIK